MKSSLFARWIVINSLVVAFFTTGLIYDIITRFVTDEFYMSQSIAFIALIFMIRSGYVSWMIQKDCANKTEYSLKYRSSNSIGRGNDFKDSLVDKFSRRIALTKMAGTLLMSIGLMGTVIGISFSFSGIGADVLGDADASSKAIAALVAGLGVAFHTTLVGLAGAVVNMINQHMMVQETNKLFAAIVTQD
jgi:hypothetical protein